MSSSYSRAFWFSLYNLGKGCESGIAIFEWRVAWNYAYGPFNANSFASGSSLKIKL